MYNTCVYDAPKEIHRRSRGKGRRRIYKYGYSNRSSHTPYANRPKVRGQGMAVNRKTGNRLLSHSRIIRQTAIGPF